MRLLPARSLSLLLPALFAAASLFPASPASAAEPVKSAKAGSPAAGSNAVSAATGSALAQMLDSDQLVAAGVPLPVESLRSLYKRHDRPLWLGQAEPLLALLADAESDGLPLRLFHLPAIQSRLASVNPVEQAQGDLLLTDALLTWARAMRGQRVNPQTLEKDWRLPHRSFDAVAFLRTAGTNAQQMATALRGLIPTQPGYQILRQELIRMRADTAVWPKLPPGPTVHPGESDPRIPLLRQRLAASGELTQGKDTEGDLLDPDLTAALQLFQQTHGLNDDGSLGARTLATLNVSPAGRIARLQANMERWRWLPAFESRVVLVNVPGQTFELWQNGKVSLRMRVVVGDPEHPTPSLHSAIDMLVLNPVWSVPPSIATKEILPRLQRNPGYLVANELEIVGAGFQSGSPESQGAGISWADFKTFPWSLRQKPGADNALGSIKFSLPNDDSIYLHDTPNRKAFGRNYRALSHGCVRLEHPDELAGLLLRPLGWTDAQLKQALEGGKTQSVSVREKLPVWLLYFTAYQDENGVFQWRDDIYSRDQRLLEALATEDSLRRTQIATRTVTPPPAPVQPAPLPAAGPGPDISPATPPGLLPVQPAMPAN